MRKEEIVAFIKEGFLQGRNVILVGCHGSGKWEFIEEEIFGKDAFSPRKCVDASKWKSRDFFGKIRKEAEKYRGSVICIPDLFELDDSFAIINLLFDKRILFLATSSRLIPEDDPEYSSISGRFLSITMSSPDYRDWKEENGALPYVSFLLDDFPFFRGEETLLEIISSGLKGGKRVEEQSKKMLALFKHVLSFGGEPFSSRLLSRRQGYSVNTVIHYLEKLRDIGLLYSIGRMELKEGHALRSGSLYFPTFNSFLLFSKDDLLEKRKLMFVYRSKLIGKLLSYGYEVFSGYRYSTKKGVDDRYIECGLVLKKGTRCTFMQIDFDYDEEKARNLLSVKDGNLKYFAVFSEQGLQVLPNGVRLIGIDRLIKGDLGELANG